MPKVGFARITNKFRMSVMSYTEQSSEANGLAIEIWTPGASQADFSVDVPTPANSEWQMHTAEIQIGVGYKEVRIRIRGSEYAGSIAASTMVAQRSWNFFNSHSERLNWHNNETGARAGIVPYGDRLSTNEMSWAGLVFDGDKNIAEQYTLRNRQMAIDPDLQYAVCYRIRSFPAGSAGLGRLCLEAGLPPAVPIPDRTHPIPPTSKKTSRSRPTGATNAHPPLRREELTTRSSSAMSKGSRSI